MSKWRPTESGCLYVIPDIHGCPDLLERILVRILPLRKNKGVKDKIVFLGDYIDRGYLGHEVLDTLISLKKKYKESIICLKGNHECMLLEGLGFVRTPSESYKDSMYRMWKEHGGEPTVIGYLERSGADIEWGEVPRRRITQLIPREHIEFMKSLEYYHETDDFIFVHGGCDPDVNLANQSKRVFCWDRSLIRFAELHRSKRIGLGWDKIVVTGHNGHGRKEPFVYDKFMMLDCAGLKKLYVVELNSMESFVAQKDKNRLVKYELNV